MKLTSLFILFARKQVFIKNSDKPTCNNCLYFKEDSNPHNKYHLSKCELFGVKDNISGEIEYMYTKTCRNYDNFCGKDGKYYKVKEEV